MAIRVSDEELGGCVITPKVKITKEEKYIIKSLAILQIMTMNSREDPEKFKEFFKILKRATQQIEELYGEEKLNEFVSNEQFNS